jgi:hypothetical protein
MYSCTAASITRLVYIKRDFPGLTTTIEDVSWNLRWSTTWTSLELNIAVICGCLPQLRPLLSSKGTVAHPTHSKFSTLIDPSLKTVDPVKFKSRPPGDVEDGGLRLDDAYLELDSVDGGSSSDERDRDERKLVVQGKGEEQGSWNVTVVQDWNVTSQRGSVMGGTNDWDVSGPK